MGLNRVERGCYVGPNKAKWGKTEPNKFKRGQKWSNGAELGQTEPNGAKWGQTLVTQVKWDQAGPNGVTILGLERNQPSIEGVTWC